MTNPEFIQPSDKPPLSEEFKLIWKETKRAREQLVRDKVDHHKFSLEQATEYVANSRKGRIIRALRAVTSLHKPAEIDSTQCNECWLIYPCPTLNVIVSVLKGEKV